MEEHFGLTKNFSAPPHTYKTAIKSVFELEGEMGRR